MTSGNFYFFVCVHEVSGNTTKPNLVMIFHSFLLPVLAKRRKFRGAEKHTNQMQLSISVSIKRLFWAPAWRIWLGQGFDFTLAGSHVPN